MGMIRRGWRASFIRYFDEGWRLTNCIFLEIKEESDSPSPLSSSTAFVNGGEITLHLHLAEPCLPVSSLLQWPVSNKGGWKGAVGIGWGWRTPQRALTCLRRRSPINWAVASTAHPLVCVRRVLRFNYYRCSEREAGKKKLYKELNGVAQTLLMSTNHSLLKDRKEKAVKTGK